MISIGIYDNLTLRLDSYATLINSLTNTSILFAVSTQSQLVSNLKHLTPDVFVLLTTKPDNNFKKVMGSIKSLGQKTIVITTEVSKWLIPNLKSLKIAGYIVMGTRSSSLEDAIISVSRGEFYCCKEVSAVILDINSNSFVEFSNREREIIKLLADDKSTKEIAYSLSVSPHTVSSHRKKILEKFEVNSTTGMVKKAIDAGLV